MPPELAQAWCRQGGSHRSSCPPVAGSNTSALLRLISRFCCRGSLCECSRTKELQTRSWKGARYQTTDHNPSHQSHIQVRVVMGYKKIKAFDFGAGLRILIGCHTDERVRSVTIAWIFGVVDHHNVSLCFAHLWAIIRWGLCLPAGSDIASANWHNRSLRGGSGLLRSSSA